MEKWNVSKTVGKSMVKVTKLPPGEAAGARDLQIWSSRRLAGGAGVGGKEFGEKEESGSQETVRCTPCGTVDWVFIPQNRKRWRITCRYCGHAWKWRRRDR